MSDIESAGIWNEVWLERAGARLFALEAGRAHGGAPVIFLHGGVANHLVCRPYAAPLAAAHLVVTPDLRASGRSHFAGELSWDLLADDIAALIRALGAPRAVVGGVSFGSGVAVRVALRHPELVWALIVMSPVFPGDDAPISPASAAAMLTLDAFGRRAPAEGIAVFLAIYDQLPPPLRERARAMASAFDPASVAASTRFLAATAARTPGAQPFARAEDLAAIAAPTLVVPGNDPQHPASVAERYVAHIPNCTTAPVADAASIDAFVAANAR